MALKVSTGDLKHVVDTIEMLVIKQVDEYKYQLNALKIRLVRAHQIPLFDWAVEYVLLEALDLVLDYYKKLKEGKISQECDGVFERTMRLPCAYTCKKRQTQGKPLLLASFHKRWRYSNQTVPNEDIDIPYELTRNPAIIPRKRRKGSRQAISSTRRDPSH